MANVIEQTMQRRKFLVRMWQAGVALVAAAGAWTSWDLLRPKSATGFGGEVRAIPPESVPETGVIEVPAARSYLVNINQVTAFERHKDNGSCHFDGARSLKLVPVSRGNVAGVREALGL